jgi:hypothetical protein
MSSKRNLRRRMCSDKRAYPEIGRAYAARKGHASTFGEWLSVYRCPFCRQHHLGHPWESEKRTRRNFKEVA